MTDLNLFLAVLGTILVLFPVVAPVFLSLVFFIQSGQLLFDDLMPAELFLFALMGCGLLLWATWRTHLRQQMIGWDIGLASVSGLDSGETEPVGWLVAIVTGAIVGYGLSLVEIGAGGVLLVRDLLKR